jgi:membrane-bound metal-dependent hydrolase YbcI (DUF457 family)
MMGRTHGATGALAGLLVGRLLGLDSLSELLPFAAVGAGYVMVPDLDHEGSTATRSLGPLTWILSRLLRLASRGVYALTKGPRDEDCSGAHRHLSHTLVFALALGGLCTWSTKVWGTWAVMCWLAVGLWLAVEHAGRLAVLAYVAGTATWLPAVWAGTESFGEAATAALEETTGWLGIAVALGCFTHCLGDALTKAGCPFLWPIPIAGETWYELRPPKWLRFKTGGKCEKFVFGATVVGCAAAVPGAIDLVVELFAEPARVAGYRN